MKKAWIYVEGQTEERFVKALLQGHLAPRGIHAEPILAATKVVKSGKQFKGGLPGFEKVRKELKRLLGDTSAAVVTTFLDFYGLPRDFPGRDAPEGNDCYARALYVERRLAEAIDHPRFIPNLVLHEYEGLLFSAPGEMARTLPRGEGLRDKFARIRRDFRTPEEINDDPTTAAHRRIEGLYPAYRKPLHGPLIAARIGLEAIRRECPHFHAWVRRLEEL